MFAKRCLKTKSNCNFAVYWHINNKIEETERNIQELKEKKEYTTDEAELIEIDKCLDSLNKKLTRLKQVQIA